MNKEEFFQSIKDADMVLVGLGEEFDGNRILRTNEAYQKWYNVIEKSTYTWMFPFLKEAYRDKQDQIYNIALEHLSELLESKNYYIVSTSTNQLLRDYTWKNDRIVLPCGSAYRKQCENGCESEILDVTDEEKEKVRTILFAESFQTDAFSGCLGKCSNCGENMVLNNVYAAHYKEDDYLKKWDLYMKWLTGTVNKKLLILELGAGMQYASVIRNPFERIAFINNKAQYYRINENFYTMEMHLKEKGVSQKANAIDWLAGLW